MRAVCLTLVLIGVLISPAVAGDLAPKSSNALHFRLDVGVEPGHMVTGWLDRLAEGEGGFDAVVLDLDADGKPETVQGFATRKDPRTGKDALVPKISVERDGANWTLDLAYSRFQVNRGVAQAYIRWTVTKGSFYAWFINGRVNFHATAEGAAEATPIRLGPPFTFETGARTRGLEALVRVGLKDGNGCTMRLARDGTAERRIRVELEEKGETRYETWANYG